MHTTSVSKTTTPTTFLGGWHSWACNIPSWLPDEGDIMEIYPPWEMLLSSGE